MSTVTAPPRLSAEQARKLHDADVAVAKLRAQLKIAEKTLNELEERYHPRIALSDDPGEAAKGIRVAEAGGVHVRVAPFTTAERFSLKAYREAGHKITAAMRDCISAGKPAARWTIKAVDGPKKLGAVEPT